jgi:hypothetical protein
MTQLCSVHTHRRLFAPALCAAVLLATSAAHAVPLAFNATLKLDFGSRLGVVTASGSGVGDSGGAGGTASIGAGSIPLQVTQPLPFNILFVLFDLAVGAPGQNGANAPFAGGGNAALSWNGSTGTMGLAASAYLLNKNGKAVAALPLSQIGVGGGLVTFSVLNNPGTIFANAYQLGMVTVAGGIPSSGAVTVVGTGFDARTVGGAGTLQLVSPTSFDLGALGSIPLVATLTLQFVPEPATALLLGLGLAVLAVGRRS